MNRAHRYGIDLAKQIREEQRRQRCQRYQYIDGFLCGLFVGGALMLILVRLF